ncbi:MAG: TatD family hydrolase [Bacteroidia bacterium]
MANPPNPPLPSPKGIDTHAHLYVEEFQNEWEPLTTRVTQACQAVLLPNLDADSLPSLLSLCQIAPNLYFPMIGLHPCHVQENFSHVLHHFETLLPTQKWYGIGEIGLDLYHTPHTLPLQKQALHRQLEWAAQLKLPVSLHFRNAFAELRQEIAPYKGKIQGVFHCFTGGYEEAKIVLDLGFHVGIGGVVTFKNAPALHETLRKIPLSAVVLETDSPYLAPVPFRGKRNESTYLPYIAQAIAKLKNLSEIEVLEVTSSTAQSLFGI